MPFTYAIVNFVDTNEVEVVPMTWISENACVWPPLKGAEVKKLAKKLAVPSDEWLKHNAKVIGRYETYDEARLYLKKAEDTSDLASDNDYTGRGRRKIFSRHYSSDDDTLTFTETTGIVVPTMQEEQQEESCAVENVLNVVTVDQMANVETAINSLKKEISTVKELLKVIISNQEAIMSKMCDSGVPSTSMDKLPFALPIRSMEELFKVENAIENSSTAETLTKKLSICGGSTIEATVKRIMVKVIDNSVAQHFSWFGAKGKEVFSKLHLTDIIFDATRRNAKLGDACTDAAIEVAIKNWLRHAKARHMSRTEEEKYSQSII